MKKNCLTWHQQAGDKIYIFVQRAYGTPIYPIPSPCLCIIIFRGNIHCQDDLLRPHNPEGQIGYWHGNKVNNNRSDMKSLWTLFK